MDFFEAQARAKKRTTRLVVLFVLAVLGTIAAAYAAAIVAQNVLHGYADSRHRGYDEDVAADDDFALWRPGLLLGVTAGTLAIVGLSSLVKWSEFSSGGSAVAESVGGRRVDPHTTDLGERRLLNVVEEMAIASGVPMPAVYLLADEPAINAFAAGLTTSDAVVTVTRGAMEKLTRDELQGVIGHEFSHILNGDMRLNLRITAVVFGILVLGLAGRGVLWSLRGARFSSGRNKNGGGIVAAIAIVGLSLLIVGYVGYFFGRLIQAAVSRQREFLADASSVQFTRNPGGISGALKKIGGYALGSTLQTSKAAAIGHFFFAQSFRSGITGLWATHPPLGERIRAIEPGFDGKYFEPPTVVDLAHESFRTAGFAPGAVSAPAAIPPKLAPGAATPAAFIAAAGTISPEAVANAQLLLDAIPDRLREAARTAAEAPVLLFALLLDADTPAIRTRQLELVRTRAGAAASHLLEELAPLAARQPPAHRLPLVQLALPALRTLTPAALGPFLDTLDELVHADGRVSTFEFAVQKLLTRSLALGRKPTDAVIQVYSFNAVTNEIAVVLSALAHVASNLDLDARAAFAAGAAQLKLIEAALTFRGPEDCAPAALDAALDKLATASLPIKQRTLVAAAHVVGADGQVLVAEAELLRAIAAALDVPLPPLAA